MNTFIKVLLIAVAFIILNLVFGGITVHFNGIPFGIITLIFGIGFFSGKATKK